MARETTEKPKRRNPFRQMGEVYKTVRTIDPAVTWWMLGAFAGVTLVITLIGWLLGYLVIGLITGLLFGILAAMLVLGRRGERAAYGQLAGQTGATAGGLSALRRGWYVNQEPIAADVQRQGDLTGAALVFRVLGRPGVVLLSEGPRGRADKLIVKERKKVERVAPGVPVHTFHVGEGEDDLKVAKISRTLSRLKPQLTKDEMGQVNKRLKSIPGIRQAVPAGVDPTKVRMDRKALRGR